MVKGLHDDIDQVLDTKEVPYIVKTYLLMFENNIIYTSIIRTYGIDFGNRFKKMALNDIENALKYYHL